MAARPSPQVTTDPFSKMAAKASEVACIFQTPWPWQVWPSRYVGPMTPLSRLPRWQQRLCPWLESAEHSSIDLALHWRRHPENDFPKPPQIQCPEWRQRHLLWLGSPGHSSTDAAQHRCIVCMVMAPCHDRAIFTYSSKCITRGLNRLHILQLVLRSYAVTPAKILVPR